MERTFRDLLRLSSMENIQRQPDLGDIFEKLLVPAVFERYARDLVERARPFGPSDRILDLGCGTGIVARILRERLGAAARITGLDVSAPMIAKARSLAPDIEWHEGNAMALPFADGSFDVVLGQQVLQFVPDRAQAVREIHRVLVPGGRVVLATWRPRPMQPMHEMFGQVAERHFGKGNDKRYSLDGDELRTLLAEFSPRMETVSLVEHWNEVPPHLLKLSVGAGGFDTTVADAEARFAKLIAETQAELPRFAANGGYETPSITNIAIGRKS